METKTTLSPRMRILDYSPGSPVTVGPGRRRCSTSAGPSVDAGPIRPSARQEAVKAT